MVSNHNRAGAGSIHRRAAQNQLKGAKTKEDYKKAAETGITGQMIAEFEAAEAKDDLAYERQKHSPFNEFAQVNMDWDTVYKLMTLVDKPCGGAAMKVYLLMTKLSDRTNALIVGVKTIADCLGISKEMVNKAIKTLKDNQFVQSAKVGNSTVYLLNPDIAYKGYGKFHGLCQFQGSIVLNADEAKQIKKLKKMVVNKATKTAFIMNNGEMKEVPLDMPWDAEFVEDNKDE